MGTEMENAWIAECERLAAENAALAAEVARVERQRDDHYAEIQRGQRIIDDMRANLARVTADRNEIHRICDVAWKDANEACANLARVTGERDEARETRKHMAEGRRKADARIRTLESALRVCNATLAKELDDPSVITDEDREACVRAANVALYGYGTPTPVTPEGAGGDDRCNACGCSREGNRACLNSFHRQPVSGAKVAHDARSIRRPGVALHRRERREGVRLRDRTRADAARSAPHPRTRPVLHPPLPPLPPSKGEAVVATKKTYYGCACGRLFGTEAEANDCDASDKDSAEWDALREQWNSLEGEMWPLSKDEYREAIAWLREHVARARLRRVKP